MLTNQKSNAKPYIRKDSINWIFQLNAVGVSVGFQDS